MIAVSSGLKVLVATKPIDFRKGVDGLAALVKEHLGADPFSGTVFVFRAKRADRIKLIVWDGTGLCLFAKRLEEGTFRWPKIEDGIMRLTPAQLSALIEGLDGRVCVMSKYVRRPRCCSLRQIDSLLLRPRRRPW
jgi:transposase